MWSLPSMTTEAVEANEKLLDDKYFSLLTDRIPENIKEEASQCVVTFESFLKIVNKLPPGNLRGQTGL